MTERKAVRFGDDEDSWNFKLDNSLNTCQPVTDWLHDNEFVTNNNLSYTKPEEMKKTNILYAAKNTTEMV